MFDLTNKVALVTGGQGGMGKAHAIALAEQGAKVIVTDLDLDQCATVTDEIKSRSGESACFKMDVSNKRNQKKKKYKHQAEQ